MKRIVALFVGLVVALFAVPGYAQSTRYQELADGNRPFGDLSIAASPENQELVNDLKLVVAHLRLAPLNPREVCDLWQRYDASRVLYEFTEETPSLVTALGTNQMEVQTFRQQTANLLAQMLNNFLDGDHSDPLPMDCGYWGYVGRNSIFRRTVNLRNEWELAEELLRVQMNEKPKLTGRVYSHDEITDKIKDYIMREGAEKFRKGWLDGNWQSESRTLRSWLVDYGFAPSLLGLTPAQTAKLLENSGKK